MSIAGRRQRRGNAMHLARAASLADLGEPSLALGAIPFHHEQAGGDAETLLAASRSCLDMACYDAALDWSVRGRRMLAGTPRGKSYGDLTWNMLFALLLLGRYDEVATLCEDLLAHSVDSALLAHATYAMAILNARLYERSRRDYDAAKSWIEKSREFTDATPPSPTRAVNADIPPEYARAGGDARRAAWTSPGKTWLKPSR